MNRTDYETKVKVLARLQQVKEQGLAGKTLARSIGRELGAPTNSVRYFARRIGLTLKDMRGPRLPVQPAQQLVLRTRQPGFWKRVTVWLRSFPWRSA